jgi:hypothetical protein
MRSRHAGIAMQGPLTPPAKRGCVRHGACKTKEYIAYQNAKQRCENPKDKSYKNYGQRGILFLWPSFEVFFAEMGEAPLGTSLDRINNQGHYESDNCRWATAEEQSNNRRDNRLLTAFGRTQAINH